MEATNTKASTSTIDGAVIKSKSTKFTEELRGAMGMPSPEEIERRIEEGKRHFNAHADEKKREQRKIPLSALRPSPTNPRKTFTGLEGLGASLEANGCVQALVVRPWVDQATKVVDPHKFEIICGERRYRAAKLQGIKELPCDVRADLPDSVVADMQVVENLQRKGLTPIEEAESFDALMKRFHYTADQVAAKHGVEDGEKLSGSTVRGRCKLLALGPEARAAVAEGWLPQSVGTVLARSVPSHALQAKWIKEHKRQSWDVPGTIETISARQAISNLQTEFAHNLAKAPFDPKDADLVPVELTGGPEGTQSGGACAKCPHNAANLERGLFEDLGAKPGQICTFHPCYALKVAAHTKIKEAELEGQGIEVLKGKEAEKAMGYSSGLSKLNEKNYNHPKGATWGELLEKLPVDERPELVAVTTREGEIVQLVDTKAITKAVAKTSGAKWAKGDAESAEKRKKELAKRKENEKDQVKRRKIAATLAAGIGRAAKVPDLELWRLLADRIVSDGHLSEDQLEALGFPETGKGDPIDRLIETIEKKGTVDQVRAIAVAAVIMFSDLNDEFEYRDDDKNLRALAKRHGVKVDDVFRAFENAEKAEALMAGGKAKPK